VTKYSFKGNNSAPYGFIASIDSIASPGDPTQSPFACTKYELIDWDESKNYCLLIIQGPLEFSPEIEGNKEIIKKVASSIKKSEPKSHEEIVSEVAATLKELTVLGDHHNVSIWVLTSGFAEASAQSSHINYKKINDDFFISKSERCDTQTYQVGPSGYFPEQIHFTETVRGKFLEDVWSKISESELESLMRYSKDSRYKNLTPGVNKDQEIKIHQWYQNITVELSNLATCLKLKPFSMGKLYFFDVTPDGIIKLEQSD